MEKLNKCVLPKNVFMISKLKRMKARLPKNFSEAVFELSRFNGNQASHKDHFITTQFYYDGII